MNRGSIFRRWDLHVHTPASFENNYRLSSAESAGYRGDIWEKYVSKLEEVTGVCGLGLTDYFTIDGYKKVLEFRSKGRLANIDLILPNVEFRLSKFVGDKSVNYHVIFSNELEPEVIEREFLEDLKFEVPGGEKKRLDKRNIEAFGKAIKNTQAGSKGDSDWVVGCKNVVIPLEDIINVLRGSSRFEGKYILGLAEPEWALIDWEGRDHTTRKNLLIQSHCIFSSNQNTRDWALGLKNASARDFTDEFGSLKACIHGSDCHDFERLCKPESNKFCWIKSDTTFEGLKQVLYEPADRIRIQASNPDERKHIYSLASVKIYGCRVNSDLSIQETEIGINRDLVTIMGGKGSGKTAILDLVANCFVERCYRNGLGAIEEKNSFVQRIESDNPELTVAIEFLGPGADSFSKRFTDDKLFQGVKVTYLPQGQIEEFSGNRKKLNEKIWEVIFKNKEVVEGNFEDKFRGIEAEIEECNKSIEELTTNIVDFEMETTDEIVKALAEKVSSKNGDLKNKTAQLSAIRENISGEAQGKAEELRNNEQALREKASKVESLDSNCDLLEQELKDSKGSLGTDIEKVNVALSELGIELEVPPIDYSKQMTALRIALDKATAIGEEVAKQVGQVEGELAKLEGLAKAEAEILGGIKDIEGELESLAKQQLALDKKKEDITRIENERLGKYVDLLAKFDEWKEFYKQVIGSFSKESSGILSGVRFESDIHFDRIEFIERGKEIFNMNRVREEEIIGFGDSLENAVKQKSREQITADVSAFISRVLGHRSHLKQRKSNLDFYQWVFANYYSLNTNVFFNNTHMDKLSIGQKGTVLLKIFLAEGDYPLILDMPEENLDNKFIYSELVEAFRQAKKKRQIIIATNNANLVVNTDAEEVIVAEFKNNIIKYIVGSIEDKSIRNEMTTILEGGEEALRNRERKYGMQAAK